MTNLIFVLSLSLPAQAPPPPAARPDLAAQRQAELGRTVERRRAQSRAKAVARLRDRAEAADLYRAELEYRARVAPVVAEQQYRQAQLNAQAQSDQAWLRIARHRNLAYAYGVGAPVTAGP